MNKGASSSIKSVRQKSGNRWSQDRRMEFIDFTLRWEGQLNRSDLTNHFGISVPQSSLDIARYSEIAPKNLRYDRSSRVYLATDEFESAFKSSGANSYLHGMLSARGSDGAGGYGMLASFPAIQTVPVPARIVDEKVLAHISRAIRQGSALNINYQSMTSKSPASRLISPHALGHDGYRWHVRAYCHKRKDFRDFVMARILEVTHSGELSVPASQDTDWNTEVTLVLVPDPRLTTEQCRIIELDYGMTNGTVEFQCSKAMLFYLLKRLQLIPNEESPQSKQVVLKNLNDFAEQFPLLSGVNKSIP